MLLNDEQLDNLVKGLIGTKDEIQSHLPRLKFEHKLTNRDFDRIFEKSFRCACCNTWRAKEDESEDKQEHCIECTD